MSRRISKLEDHLGYWLRFVSNGVSKEFAASLAKKEISVAEWVMLRILFDCSPASLGKLGKATGMTKGAVSKALDRLLSKSLVRVTSAQNDRRALSIELTAKGSRMVPQLAQLADRNDKKFFSSLSAAEAKTLKQILQKLVSENQFFVTPTD